MPRYRYSWKCRVWVLTDLYWHEAFGFKEWIR